MSGPEQATTILGLLDPPLWLVTATHGERHGGLIASNVTSVSIVPDLPRMLVGLARRHATWDLVEASGAFTLHLLSTEQLDLVWRFGMTSGRDHDKFAGLTWRPGPTGSPILPEALGWMACRVEGRLETGDRTLYLAEVVDAERVRPGTPLTLQTMLAGATPEQKAELKRQLQQDAADDAEVIRAWRGQA